MKLTTIFIISLLALSLLSPLFITTVKADPTEITTIDGLWAIRSGLAGDYILMNDLDFDNVSHYVDDGVGAAAKKTENTTGNGWYRIGAGPAARFTGTLDGDNYTISNLFINCSSNADYENALFGGCEGIIKNLNLVDVNITSDTVAGAALVGLLGPSSGGGTTLIDNCYVSGILNFSSTEGGGVVGRMQISTMNNTHFNGEITTTGDKCGGLVAYIQNAVSIENCSSRANITGTSSLGVFVGHQSAGTIKDSYAIGNVSGTTMVGVFGGMVVHTVINCYAIGNASGTDSIIGGFAGQLVGSTVNITNCYVISNLVSSSTSPAGGFTGKSGNSNSKITSCYAISNEVIAEHLVAGFSGWMTSGTISECYAIFSYVNATNAASYGRSGGFIAYIENGNILDSYALNGTVSRNAGTKTDFGGFCGLQIGGVINNSYTNCNVSCGGATTKGFIGTQSSGSDNNNFFDNESSNQLTTAGSATGVNTSNMKTFDTFNSAGWDISYTTVDLNSGFPYLSWQNNSDESIWLLEGEEEPSETPTAFTATTFNDTRIDLSWTKGAHATNTIIEWNSTETWTRGEATEIYNSTGTSYSHTGCDPDTTYYYQAWSWSALGYNDSYATANNKTDKTTQAPTITNPNPPDTDTGVSVDLAQVSATFEHPEGETFNWTIQGSFLTNSNANGASNGSKTATVTDTLDYDTEYTWYANATYDDKHTNETFTFTTRSEPASWSNFSANWTIAEDHTVDSTGYLYGNWSHSEHFAEGLGPEGYDEYWSYSNASVWSVEDHSSWWAGNATFEADMNLSIHAFAVLNSSGMNRSQSFGWLHLNQSSYEPIWPYIIFAYNNASDFYVVAFTPTGGGNPEGVWLMHWNGTNMTNLNGTPIIDPYIEGENLFSQDVEYALGDYKLPEGAFYKLLYNSKSAYIDFKCWWDSDAIAMSEPIGWCMSDNNATLQHPDDPMGYGIGVWNPYEVNATVQWDLLNLWQINRTTNASNTIEINDTCDNVSEPHMEFPVLNMTVISDTYWEYYDNYSGNITSDTIQDIMLEYTNMYNMETITASAEFDQFDNIYYYSALLTNLYDFLELEEGEEPPAWLYDEYLYIHVQMCPISCAGFEQMVVGIDVDDDGTWDGNDRLFFIDYDPVMDDVLLTQYNGEFFIGEGTFLGTVWETAVSGVANLHRYNTHLNYQIMIPLAELVKDDGHPLNASDVFGLSISNTMACYADVFTPFFTWQDWNETTEDPCMVPLYDSFYYFYGNEGPDPLLTAWGEGVITGEFVGSGETTSNAEVNASFNSTHSEPDDDWFHMNVSIWVNNTGSGTLNDLEVNITWWNCSCADLDMTYIDSNVSLDNWTWYNDSCYAILNTTSLAAGATWHIWFTVNITNCSGVTTASETMNVSVNATELDLEVESGDSPSFTWGIYATGVCVSYTTPVTDVGDIGDSVFSIVGILLIIAAIFMIVVVIRRFDLF